jgi:O-succinylbenzoic acid--CoA ligase
VLTGGAAIPRRLLERAVEAGWPVSPTYGLTEAGSQVATVDPNDVACPEIGVLDRPLDGVEIRVGEHGDVSVRSPSLMLGYLGQPIGQSAIDADGWFVTGDLAARGESGALDVVGRRSSRIITGGSNVDPREVEDVLRDHPAVDDVCVVGVPDERWGEIVVAVVAVGSGVTNPGDSRQEASLREWSLKHLDGPRRPRRWRIVDRLPSTPNGKVDRRAVRAAAERIIVENTDGPAGC